MGSTVLLGGAQFVFCGFLPLQGRSCAFAGDVKHTNAENKKAHKKTELSFHLIVN